MAKFKVGDVIKIQYNDCYAFHKISKINDDCYILERLEASNKNWNVGQQVIFHTNTVDVGGLNVTLIPNYIKIKEFDKDLKDLINET